MSDDGSIYVIVPILIVVKIVIWASVCYCRSQRYNDQRVGRQIIVAHPTTIIHRSVQHTPHDIQGIENPGYMQPPPEYNSVVGGQTYHSQSLPTYDDAVKSLNCHQTVVMPS